MFKKITLDEFMRVGFSLYAYNKISYKGEEILYCLTPNFKNVIAAFYPSQNIGSFNDSEELFLDEYLEKDTVGLLCLDSNDPGC